MIYVTPFQIFELFIGLFTFWVGVHQLSQNAKSTLSWLVFFFFLTFGFIIFTDPIVSTTPDYKAYVLWQKITDWPLFLMPTLCLHIAVYVNNLTKKLKPYLFTAYTCSLFLFFADLKGGLVLKESIVRFNDFRRIDSFAPGVLMIPFVIFCVVCFITGIYYFNMARKATRNNKYILPMLGLIIISITAIITGAAYYINISSVSTIFDTGTIIGPIFFVYFILSYYQLVNNERNIFDKSFIYKTIVLCLVIGYYVTIFLSGRGGMNFLDLIFMTFLVFSIIISHSAYEWLNTFVNDLLYNPDAGFSVVSDEEVGNALKNYTCPEKLEDSSLLRLKIIYPKKGDGQVPVDNLKKILSSTVEYFKPEENENRRTKQNLKYQLLRMLVFDEAEEGQILWELGFEGYPVRIMNQSSLEHKPKFADFGPADYTYTSRNAYLALKKEAIHDVTWRISYLEKLAKK